MGWQFEVAPDSVPGRRTELSAIVEFSGVLVQILEPGRLGDVSCRKSSNQLSFRLIPRRGFLRTNKKDPIPATLEVEAFRDAYELSYRFGLKGLPYSRREIHRNWVARSTGGFGV
jgi:hypothetical protein